MGLHGLLLRPTDASNGEYKRIGSFVFQGQILGNSNSDEKDDRPYFDDDEIHHLYFSFESFLEQNGEITVAAACSKVTEVTLHPREKYLITIV